MKTRKLIDSIGEIAARIMDPTSLDGSDPTRASIGPADAAVANIRGPKAIVAAYRESVAD